MDFLDKYNIKKSFTKEYEKIYEHRDEISFNKFDVELYDLFKEFALLTHSIGNFVLGPFGFNCADTKSKAKLYTARNWSTFDRMDLFLSAVGNGDTYGEWERWYSEKMESTYTDCFYSDIKKTKDNRVNLSESTLINLGDKNMHIRLKTINSLIKDRGAAMVDDLRIYEGRRMELIISILAFIVSFATFLFTVLVTYRGEQREKKQATLDVLNLL